MDRLKQLELPERWRQRSKAPTDELVPLLKGEEKDGGLMGSALKHVVLQGSAGGGSAGGDATPIAGAGLLRRKVTGRVVKREGGGLLQPAEPGGRAHLGRHGAALLLCDQDASLD